MIWDLGHSRSAHSPVGSLVAVDTVGVGKGDAMRRRSTVLGASPRGLLLASTGGREKWFAKFVKNPSLVTMPSRR